jgi:diketogulonate reductase-like aldo/keto reductase
MRKVSIPSGEKLPALGQGTWNMGVNPMRKKNEVEALQLGLDLGMTLIDTAEMYADGKAEEIVAEAVKGRRHETFIVTKVIPSHAKHNQVISSCDKSLNRLGTDRIDLYLLHWRGNTPLEETLRAFTELMKAGKIRHWGVSNFDTSDMKELVALKDGGAVATNQILYNPARRGPEWELLPWCRERNIPIMAYSPVDQGGLAKHPVLKNIAKRHQASAAQIALAWLLLQEQTIVIPKAVRPDHVRENRKAADLQLTEADLHELNIAFPPPTRAVPLETA